DRVDGVFEDVAVLPQNDAADPTLGVLDRDAALVQVHRDPALLHAYGEGLPHLPWAEPRVPELLDQRRHVLATYPQDREHRLAEREVLDPLRRPERADLRAGNAPELLGVGAEERVVQTPPEARRHPFLERFGLRAAVPCRRPQVRKRAPRGLE